MRQSGPNLYMNSNSNISCCLPPRHCVLVTYSNSKNFIFHATSTYPKEGWGRGGGDYAIQYKCAWKNCLVLLVKVALSVKVEDCFKKNFVVPVSIQGSSFGKNFNGLLTPSVCDSPKIAVVPLRLFSCTSILCKRYSQVYILHT